MSTISAQRLGQPSTCCWTRPSRQRQRQRHRLAVRAGEMPTVDWTRRSVQQVLFVDRTDTVRARFAVGILERVAAWVGLSRALQAWSCGVDAEAGSRIPWGTQASLFGLADSWKLRPHLFTSARQRFEEDDIERFELIVCLDSGVQTEVLKQLSAARPAEPHTYVTRICSLTDFVMYCSDEQLMQAGSRGVMDRQLRDLVRLALPSLRPSAAKVAAAAAATAGGTVASGSTADAALDLPPPLPVVPAYMLPTGIHRPELQGGGSVASLDEAEAGVASSSGSSGTGERWERAERWERMALLMAVCCAGLVQYLLDCLPEELLED